MKRIECPLCGKPLDPVARPYHPSHDLPARHGGSLRRIGRVR